MTGAAKTLLKHALALPEADRVHLAKELLGSVHSGDAVDAEWQGEIARRLNALRSGRVKPIPAARVLAELYAAQARDESRPRRRSAKHGLDT